jgi:uncharacterized protein (TIGR04255 family)
MELGIPEQPKLLSSPLRLALCQFRFPRLFGLTGAEVRPFAKAIFDDFPKTSEDQLVSQQLEISPQGIRHHGTQPEPAYRFEAAEGGWTATLTQEWLALETTGYNGFPDFAERWLALLQRAIDHLGLEHESRLGLRYVNELRVGADATPASLGKVLSTEVLGPLGLDPEAAGLFRSWQEVRFKHVDGGCTMQHGFGQNTSQDWVYVLDFDGFREGHRDLNAEEQVRALAGLNHHIFGLFSRSVTPETFQSFEPEAQT